MPDASINSTADVDERPKPAAPARCLRCSADLSRLPEWARYCPQCGLDSHQSPPAALLAHAVESDDPTDRIIGWEHLRHLAASGGRPAPDVSVAPRSASLILTGYSNAMYNLGRRYESGLGAAKNPREAARCYVKAARLGNFWAVARLANRYLHLAPRNPRDQNLL